MFDDRTGYLYDALTGVSLLSRVAGTAQRHVSTIWV